MIDLDPVPIVKFLMWRENARKTKDPLFEFWRAHFLSPFSNLNFTEEFISRFQTLSSFALIQKQVSERAQDDVKLEIEMERESNDLPPSSLRYSIFTIDLIRTFISRSPSGIIPTREVHRCATTHSLFSCSSSETASN